MAPQRHTATITIANPSNANDPWVRKSKCPSHRTNKEIESAPKKKKKKRVQCVQKSYEQRIEDLRAYKEKHGHVNVKQKEDKSLYGFCKNIRNARNHPEKSSHLVNDDRISSLDALGFEWTLQKQAAKKSFAQRIEDLKAYKEKYGHVNVKIIEDKSLYGFCKGIRYAHKNPEKSDRALTDDRIASLDALGFDWSMSYGVCSGLMAPKRR